MISYYDSVIVQHRKTFEPCQGTMYTRTVLAYDSSEITWRTMLEIHSQDVYYFQKTNICYLRQSCVLLRNICWWGFPWQWPYLHLSTLHNQVIYLSRNLIFWSGTSWNLPGVTASAACEFLSKQRAEQKQFPALWSLFHIVFLCALRCLFDLWLYFSLPSY